MSLSQVTLVSLEELVKENHQYRKFKSIFNFEAIEPELKLVESAANYKGYGTGRLFSPCGKKLKDFLQGGGPNSRQPLK